MAWRWPPWWADVHVLPFVAPGLGQLSHGLHILRVHIGDFHVEMLHAVANLKYFNNLRASTVLVRGVLWDEKPSRPANVWRPMIAMPRTMQ